MPKRRLKWGEWLALCAPSSKNLGWYAEWKYQHPIAGLYRIECDRNGRFRPHWWSKQIGSGGLPTLNHAKQICEFHAEQLILEQAVPENIL